MSNTSPAGCDGLPHGSNVGDKSDQPATLHTTHYIYNWSKQTITRPEGSAAFHFDCAKRLQKPLDVI